MTNHNPYRHKAIDIHLGDFPAWQDDQEYTPILETRYFHGLAIHRGLVQFVVYGITPVHAVRAEYKGMTYYGVANENGTATLSPIKEP